MANQTPTDKPHPSDAPSYRFFGTTARGLEPLFEAELRELGAETIEPRRGGVAFFGPLEIGYRACLWSRTASRILCVLDSFTINDADELYAGVRRTIWRDHLRPEQTLAIDCVTLRSPINNSQYGAQRAKDAIVDQLRDEFGQRPSVDTRNPDLRINLFLEDDRAQVAIDLAGQSLHRRGYRKSQGKAPLKENTAAAMLLLAEWPKRSKEGDGFLDAMCGSGTLLIEAALIACDTAPGLFRERFGFAGWRQHREDVWQAVVTEAKGRDRRRETSADPRLIVGYDVDHRAIHSARLNARKAGVEHLIDLAEKPLTQCTRPFSMPGVFMINPPYGERLGEAAALEPLYLELGDRLKEHFGDWTAYVLSPNTDLARAIGLKSTRRPVIYNGPIECRLLCYPIRAKNTQHEPAAPEVEAASRMRRLSRSSEAESFANRLRKNARHIGRQARRQGVQCYRVYDADLPQYSAAIDRYGDHAHLQEYAPPADIDEKRAEDRLHDMLVLTGEVLQIPPQNVHLKVRKQQRGAAQYEKLGTAGEFFVVDEGGHRFWVNLDDYLDSGLFLDHRDLRARIGELAVGRRVLNLFCYTATASVYAARAGATRTTSIDMSATYLEWARRNMDLNGLEPKKNLLQQTDCLEWIRNDQDRYGVIFVDPPTFSNSKRMNTTFDVQRDHGALIRSTMRLLEPQGVMVFSCNFRRFKLDEAISSTFEAKDIGKQTLPFDFERRSRGRNVWQITAKSDEAG